jgi:uracil phosphoribosyltransferase
MLLLHQYTCAPRAARPRAGRRAAAPAPAPSAAPLHRSGRRTPSTTTTAAPPSATTTLPAGGASNPRGQMLVYVPPHPLIKHYLAVARNSLSPSSLFRGALAELGRVLLYELSRDGGFLPTLTGVVDTAGGDESDAEFIDPTKPIVLVPVVRAGLPLLEHSGTVFPASTMHHVAFRRRKTEGGNGDGACDPASSSSSCSLEMTLDTLPSALSADDRVVIADACLASGQTIMRAVQEVVSRGASPWNVRVVCALAAPPALKQLADAYPGLCVYAACIDAEVDGVTGLLRPGFGDASERAFGQR